ncbi:MAG: tetratricopeptide repeat protein [Ignavibacteriaceae bacterium]|nr:tetratricopeptide repeat protein [Ignavibacteriaceae bacterium]
MFRKNSLYCLLIIFVLSTLSSAQDISQGIKLLKSEKYEAAKTYFTSLTTNPKLAPRAYFQLGELYLMLEKVDSAKICFTKGIEANKEFALNYCGLIKLNILDGNTSEIAKNEELALDYSNEKDPEVYLVMAEGYSKIKDYAKAVPLLNRALELNKQYLPAYIALGKINLEKSEGSEAVKNFQKAIDIDGKNPEALTWKAKIYVLINNYDGAIALLNEAIVADPTYAPAYNELAEIYYTKKDYAKAAENYSLYMDNSEVTLEKKKRLASILYLSKDYKKAIELSEELIKTSPDNLYSTRILAYSYFRLEDYKNSLNNFQKLFEMPSVDFLATDYENYGNLLSKTGNDSLAAIYLTKVVDMDSTRKDILSDISVLYFKNKKWDGVIATLERKNQLKAQEYFDLGKAYYFTQNYPKADSAFNILVSKVPELGIAYFWQARVKTNFDPESDQGLAQPYYEKFLTLAAQDSAKLKKEFIEAYSYLGYYHYIKEDNAKSLEYWLKVEALDPENAQAKAAIEQMKKKR